MAIVIKKTKQKLEGMLQVIAQKADITISSKETSTGKVDFVHDSWLELEGPVLSQAALNKFAKALIIECANLVSLFEFTEETGLDEYTDYNAKTEILKHFKEIL